jgi:hypothetical protein
MRVRPLTGRQTDAGLDVELEGVDADLVEAVEDVPADDSQRIGSPLSV